jgi:adhesin transport system outer membrane protein
MRVISYKLSLPAILLLGTCSLSATSIKDVVEHTIEKNPKVKSALKNNEANKLFIDEAKGGYYPKLDLTAFVGSQKTKTNPDIGLNTEEDVNGGSVQLDLEQLIYDGGRTSGSVEEAKYRFSSAKFANDTVINNVLLESVSSYLNAVKYKDRLAITNNSLEIFSKYYETAVKAEEISGEELEKYQVSSKVHYEKSRFYEEENNYLKAQSFFENSVGTTLDGNICRASIDHSIIPSDLKTLTINVISKNSEILEQVENIKEQRAVLNQKDGNNYPILKFKAQGIYDNDFISNRETTRVYNAKLELTYNIFNGNKDSSATKREKLFLVESQQKLDSVTNDILEESTSSFNTYMTSKKREVELIKYINDNLKVLEIYKDQLEGGTRTLIDVLNIERDVFNAQRDLVNIQIDLDNAYYQLLNSQSILSTSIINGNSACVDNNIKNVEKNESKKDEDTKELESLIEEDTTEKTDTEVPVINATPAKPEEIALKASNNTYTYALFLISHRDALVIEKQKTDVDFKLSGEYDLRVEKTKNFYTLAVSDIKSSEELKMIKEKLSGTYPDSYSFRKSK